MLQGKRKLLECVLQRVLPGIVHSIAHEVNLVGVLGHRVLLLFQVQYLLKALDVADYVFLVYAFCIGISVQRQVRDGEGRASVELLLVPQQLHVSLQTRLVELLVLYHGQRGNYQVLIAEVDCVAVLVVALWRLAYFVLEVSLPV